MILTVARRLGLLVVSLFVASVLVFALLRLLPGNVGEVIEGTAGSKAQIAAVNHQLGLDRPLVDQYGSWIGGALHGDLGTSAVSGVSVSSQLGQKLAVTAPLVGLSTVLALLGAVPLGMAAAARHRSASGVLISAAGQLGIAVPIFWSGLMLTALFAVHWRLLPAGGWPEAGWSEPGEALRSLVLPAVTLALAEGAILLRFVRSATLEVLHADYVRTARAKGLTRRQALVRHGMRNAAGPVISVLGLEFATLLIGSVLVESVFSLPGVGQMLITDIGNRDLTKVQGTVLLITAAVLVVGFLVDLAHQLVDPRLRAPARAPR